MCSQRAEVLILRALNVALLFKITGKNLCGCSRQVKLTNGTKVSKSVQMLYPLGPSLLEVGRPENKTRSISLSTRAD